MCRALQSEVADAAKLIQKPAELKAAVMHTYQTFVDGNAADRTRDISMEAEFNRCRWLARSGDVHGQGMSCSCVTFVQCRQGPLMLLLPQHLQGDGSSACWHVMYSREGAFLCKRASSLMLCCAGSVSTWRRRWLTYEHSSNMRPRPTASARPLLYR